MKEVRKQTGDRVSWLTDKMIYGIAVFCLMGALALEVLPFGVALRFGTGEGVSVISTFSYFDLIPLGYAVWAPMPAGILTVISIVMGMIALFTFEKPSVVREIAYGVSIIAFIISVIVSAGPILRFMGNAVMTGASCGVSIAILISIYLQYVSHRRRR